MSEHFANKNISNLKYKKESSEILFSQQDNVKKIFELQKNNQKVLNTPSFDFNNSANYPNSFFCNSNVGYNKTFSKLQNNKRSFQQFYDESENDGIKTPLSRKDLSQNIFQNNNLRKNVSNKIQNQNSFNSFRKEPVDKDLNVLNNFQVLSKFY